MSDLEPITRAENFWVNEGDLEPITRKEQYIKHLYDETQVVPEYPKTREEYFINKAGEELHDVTIEQLTVTENGTYSEAGKAFSPVIVNVPEPTLKTKSITQNGTYQASADNADGYSIVDVNVEGYKITDVSGLPASVASFQNGEKNLFTLDLATIKTLNTRGTWNDNVYTTNVSGGNQNVYTFSEDSVTLNYNGSEDYPIDLGSVQLEAGTYDFSGWTSPLGTTYITLKQATSSLFIPLNYHMVPITFDEDVTINITFWPKGLSGKTGTWIYKPTVHHTGVKDGNELPMPKLKVAVEPQQDLHGYDAPWVGGAGKNKCNTVQDNIVYVNGGVNPTVANQSITWSLSSSGAFYFLLKAFDITNAMVGNSYVMSLQSNKSISTFTRFAVFDASTSNIEDKSSTTYTITNADVGKSLCIRIYNNGTGDYTFNKIQVEQGTTATSFTPYSNECPIIGHTEANVVVSPTTDAEDGTTYTIQLGDTYYGCKVNLVSGVMTVDRVFVDMGTLNYSYYSGNLFTTPISNLKPILNSELCNALCSIYVAKQGNEYASIDGSFVAGFNNLPILAIHDSRFADANTFKNAVNGVQLVYELATPIEVQLTPTAVSSLLGVNNIWADTGDVLEASYWESL